MNHHPHLHGIHLDGSIDASGNFQQLPEINPQELESSFADNLLSSLYRDGVLPFEVIENMASWQHPGFSVHVGEVIEPEDEQHRLFLGRYLVKCPISLKRMQVIEDPLKTTVRYFRNEDNPTDFKDFSPLQFLAELQQHIPNVWEQLVRYHGVMSPRTRGAERKKRYKEKKATQQSYFIEQKEQKQPVSRQWAIWIKKVYEFDPLVCPKCGENMKIKAFIHDLNEISRFTKHLGFPAWRAPPPIIDK